MASDLFASPLDSLGVSDIQHLIDRQIEEGPRLEFKRALATNDGRPDRWMRDQSAIGSAARDDIAKEVVAFANLASTRLTIIQNGLERYLSPYSADLQLCGKT